MELSTKQNEQISLKALLTVAQTANELYSTSQTFRSQGYNFCVYDDLQSIGMKHTTDVHVELVKFVDGLSCTYVPQHAIVQYQVISGVEGSTVPLVVVSQVWVVESQSYLPGLDVIDLANRGTECEYSLSDCVFLC